MKTKKGISPLIAAVMLMALVVSIGAVIMTWTKQYVGEELEDAEDSLQSEGVCGVEVQMDLVEIGGDVQICYNTTSVENYVLRATIQNGAKVELEGIWMEVITDDYVYQNQTNYTTSKKIDATFHSELRVTDVGAVGGPIDTGMKKVTLRPVVYFESNDGLIKMVCKDHSIEREFIKPC